MLGYCWNKVIWISHLLQNFGIYILITVFTSLSCFTCADGFDTCYQMLFCECRFGVFFSFSNKKAVLRNLMHELSVLQLHQCQVSKQEPSGSFQPYTFKTELLHMKWNKNPTGAPEPAGRGQFAGTADSAGMSSTLLISTDVRKSRSLKSEMQLCSRTKVRQGEQSWWEHTQSFL